MEDLGYLNGELSDEDVVQEVLSEIEDDDIIRAEDDGMPPPFTVSD